jgi:hypothetical protein
MKGTLAIVVGASLVGASVGRADEKSLRLQRVPLEVERGETKRLDERVGAFEVVVDSLAARDERTVAKVGIRNVSAIDLEEIDLSCSAFDASGREIATSRWALTESGRGTLVRGASIDIEVLLDARASDVASATCNARGF